MLLLNSFNKNVRNLLKGRHMKSFLRRGYNELKFEDVPEVSSLIIKKVLNKNNVSFEEGYTSFIITCSMCHKNTKKPLPVYINKMTGMFLCACGNYCGQWDKLQNIITPSKIKKSSKEPDIQQNTAKLTNETLQKIRDSTYQLKTLPEDEFSEILKDFALPEIPQSALSGMDIRIDESKTNLYLPLENALSNTVGYRILNSKTKKEITKPSVLCSGILTGKQTRNKETAIVVPYISDFFGLLNSKVSGRVVCLPNGLSQLPQYVLPSFERFNKLIFWFGGDSTSWDAARSFARKLGEERCLFIRPTDQHLLPHLLTPDQDLKSIISAAKPIFHKSITTFASLREDILSDLRNVDKVQGIKWQRYPTLNKILRGHRRGELTVVTGPTGCGKTTFISEYSLDLAMQGVNTLWGSFEIRNARLARTMLQQMAGLPLDENLHMFDFWADQFEKLPIYFMTFHGQQTIKIVMEAVEHATYVHDISHVIIDNLQFMMGMTEAEKHVDRFWKQDAIIAAFRTFATRKNCHVTLVIHPRKEREDEALTTSSIFGGAKASQEADNVLIIQDKRLVSVRGKKYLQVVKNRYSGDLGIMPLDFDKASLSYAQKKRKNVDEKTDEATPET